MILIVEDEEILRFTFKSFLAKQGYEALTAEDYAGALIALSEADVDLVIADIVLGGHTGLDILREVRAKGLKCPVVMITGKPSIESASEAVRLGAYDYLIKPVGKADLLKITEQALRYKEVLDEKERIEVEKEKYRSDLEAIFGSVQEAIVTVDAHLTVMKANMAFERICGPVPHEIIGKRFDKIRSLCNQECSNILREVLENRQEVRSVRVECRQADRRRRIVVLTGSPLKDGLGNFTGAVLVIRDVTRESDLERELQQRRQFHDMVGSSGKMQEIFQLLEDLADSDTTVLVTGESGTGKELVANALHYGGMRAKKSFVKVNCSALSDALLESELFGHIRGAFTGAIQDKLGRFEMADGGSLLLDEIGDMTARLQLKLLRVIQEKEFERVGDSRPIKVDVRIIATTNRNLKESVRLGRFREDLYYRLKVVELTVPPLRERIGDIPLMADYFCKQFNRRFNRSIEGLSEDVIQALTIYPWPGNVRELEHAIEHAFVRCRSQFITREHLPPEVKSYDGNQASFGEKKQSLDLQTILEALEKTGGNKAKAARMLGINRRTIYRKLSQANDQR
jgi:PAS domain S-box-containing protein